MNTSEPEARKEGKHKESTPRHTILKLRKQRNEKKILKWPERIKTHYTCIAKNKDRMITAFCQKLCMPENNKIIFK